MYAERYATAIEIFEKTIDTPDQDPQLVAESMYWCGDSYLKLQPGELKNKMIDPTHKAYQMFKRLDWDYPTTKWARFARGRLASDERFEDIVD